jgi:hypothetical protein
MRENKIDVDNNQHNLWLGTDLSLVVIAFKSSSLELGI